MILDGVKGRGRYVGTFLAWHQNCTGWFGEGEVKFFVDGDRKFPTICGTGTEDYFGFSYGFPAPPDESLHRQHVAAGRREQTTGPIGVFIDGTLWTRSAFRRI